MEKVVAVHQEHYCPVSICKTSPQCDQVPKGKRIKTRHTFQASRGIPTLPCNMTNLAASCCQSPADQYNIFFSLISFVSVSSGGGGLGQNPGED